MAKPPVVGEQGPTLSARQALFKGAAWALAMRWGIKGMGLLSTLVLARLLSPADYGLVAMAMLVVGLVGACADFGVSASILRSTELDKAGMDGAWTLAVIQSVAIGMIVAIAAPFAATFFAEPRVTTVLLVLAGCYVLTSTGSIGVILARREFNFALEFRYHVLVKALSTMMTIGSAYILRDYRALTIGVASSYFFAWIIGYRLHPYRPKWHLPGVQRHWQFGKWLLAGGIAGYASRKADELLAGRFGQGHGLGIYSLGSELGQIVTGEVGPAMLKALLPVLARIQDEAERRAVTIKTMAGLNTVTLPLGFGLASIAPQAVSMLLGAKWEDAGVFVAVFAVYGAMQIIPAAVSEMLLAAGHSKQLAKIVWVEFAVFCLAALFATHTYGLLGLAYARVLASFVSILLTLQFGVTLGRLGWRRYCGAMFRPALATAFMVVVLWFVTAACHSWPLPLLLLVQIVGGALAYVFCVIACWILSDRPDGIETIVMNLRPFRSFIQKR